MGLRFLNKRKRESLHGKVALVTGAASGIGQELARELSARGARLALLDVNAEALAGLAEELGAASFVCDVRDDAAMANVASLVHKRLGPVHVLCVNAGVASVGPACSTPLEDAKWVWDINITGCFVTTRHFVPPMIEARGGYVVFTASIGGLIGAPGMTVYSASKFAMVGFAESLRLELAEFDISVTAICPGRVETGLHRATRYNNDAFHEYLDKPARKGFSLTPQTVARRGLDAAFARQPIIVLGVERLAVLLKRLSPALYSFAAVHGARALGLIGSDSK